MEKLAGFLVGARLYPDVYARDLVDVYARDSSNMLASFKQVCVCVCVCVCVHARDLVDLYA